MEDISDFEQLCEDTIPPFLRAAVALQWDEEQIRSKTAELTALLANHFAPPLSDEERAKLCQESERVFAALSAKDPQTLTERERMELEVATFARERL